MLDLHCHILPGVDDGAVDMADALALLDQAIEQGCQAVCATSHLGEGLFDTSAKLLEHEYARTVTAARREKIPIELFPGAENFLGPLPADVFAEKAVPLGEDGRYVLFDFSLRVPPDSVAAAISALAARDRVALIAHPERNLALQADPAPIVDWIAQGARIQVNAASVLGLLGRGAQEEAVNLLEAGAVHVLASDAHDRRRRPFCLQAGRDRVAEFLGEEEADRLTKERPWKIIRGENFDVPRVELTSRSGPRKFIRRLLNRGK